MSVTITDAATEYILGQMPQDLLEPVASIIWMMPQYAEQYLRGPEETKVAFQKITEGKWVVGWDELDKINCEPIIFKSELKLGWQPVTSDGEYKDVVIDYIKNKIQVSFFNEIV